MMNRKKMCLIIACIVVFFGGMFVYNRFPQNENTKADFSEENGYKQEYFESGKGIGVLFDEQYYSYYVCENNPDISYIERKNSNGEIPSKLLFTIDDVERIMKSVLDTRYEIVSTRIEDTIEYDKVSDGDLPAEKIVFYDEMEGGIPTGTSMGIVLDEKGYISYATFRRGHAYGVTTKDFVDKKAAFDKAIEETKKKYREKDIDFKVEFSDGLLQVYYNPTKGLCYTFEFEGAIGGNWDDPMSVFTFDPIINVYDINDVEIASSLGY